MPRWSGILSFGKIYWVFLLPPTGPVLCFFLFCDKGMCFVGSDVRLVPDKRDVRCLVFP